MFNNLESFFYKIRKNIVKFSIKNNSEKRILIYRDLTSHISSTDIDDALTSLQKECESLKSNEIIMYEEIQLGLKNQKSFHEAIAEWIPQNEALQIFIAKQSKEENSLPMAIESARIICEKKKALSSMYVSKLAYPLIMFIVAIALMLAFKEFVYDFLTGIKPFEKWEVSAQEDFKTIAYITDNLFIIITMLVAFSYGTIKFMTHGKGSFRSSLNAIPPFSIYQSVTSYTVLMSLAALTASGVQINEALRLIKKSLTGWANNELTLIIDKFEKPDDLPDGVNLTEYAFNSALFTKLVRVKVGSYARRKGFIENLNFLNRTLITDVSRQTLKSSTLLSMVVIFAVLGIILKLAIIFMSVMFSKT